MIWTSVHVRCGLCGSHRAASGPEADAVREWREAGWLIAGSTVRCPSCQKPQEIS